MDTASILKRIRIYLPEVQDSKTIKSLVRFISKSDLAQDIIIKLERHGDLERIVKFLRLLTLTNNIQILKSEDKSIIKIKKKKIVVKTESTDQIDKIYNTISFELFRKAFFGIDCIPATSVLRDIKVIKYLTEIKVNITGRLLDNYNVYISDIVQHYIKANLFGKFKCLVKMQTHSIPKRRGIFRRAFFRWAKMKLEKLLIKAKNVVTYLKAIYDLSQQLMKFVTI